MRAGEERIELAASVARALDEMGVRYALVGATAIAAHGVARSTLDIDFLTCESRVMQANWSERLRPNVIVEVRRGVSDDPLAGVVRFSAPGEAPVDLVVGRWKWQAAIVDRATRKGIGSGFEAPLPEIADLVILKIDAGGPIDIQDALLLIEVDPSAVATVDARLAELPTALQKAWKEFREKLGE